MPGKLIGSYFISVTKDLIAGSILFPKRGN